MNEYLDYSNVLIVPKKTTLASRKQAEVIRTYKGKTSKCSFEATPIIVSNLDTTGTFEVAEVANQYNITVALHKFYTPEALSQTTNLNNWVTIGMRDINWREKVVQYSSIGNHANKIIIDVANGYMETFLDFIRKVRATFPHHYIMAGNICTPDIIKDYVEAGVDCVKVGIGQGAFCRTRTTAGIGVPQFTAVLECAKEADKYGVHICADGGITEYADFSKALVAGADFVMAGSMFAGHDETADVFFNNERQFKVAYGMSSQTAMNKHYGGQDTYRASEGRTALVPYKGPLENTIKEILGSIRSTMTYTNNKNIENLCNAQWIRVNNTINNTYANHTIAH